MMNIVVKDFLGCVVITKRIKNPAEIGLACLVTLNPRHISLFLRGIMSRPLKKGLDYFPLDCQLDDKFNLIEADHGHIGFSIIIKLLQKIYSCGYYYEWTEIQQKLFAKGVNVDINTLSAVVSDCIKWGIFDASIYANSQVLTSRGIQKRYFAAIGRRTNAHKSTSFLVNDDNNPTSTELLHTETPLLPTLSAETKVKESKVKESKEAPPLSNGLIKISEYVRLSEISKEQFTIQLKAENFDFKDRKAIVDKLDRWFHHNKERHKEEDHFRDLMDWPLKEVRKAKAELERVRGSPNGKQKEAPHPSTFRPKDW